MVATRSVCVYSPPKTESDQSTEVQETPATGRRTRRTAKVAETPTHHALCKSEAGPSTPNPNSSIKRCTRASRLHSPQEPSTPVGSTHEGDVSDLESCSSVVSDLEPLVARLRGRRRQPCAVSQEEEEVSEVESCSSAVSASKPGLSIRRSTRKKPLAKSSEPASEDVTNDPESCSSAVSETTRVTRSQRKTARIRSTPKLQHEDSELSDADSCMSSVSAARSASRRATRSNRKTRPIPINLDEASESSASPALPARLTRAAARGKPAASADVSELQSCDSEGFESGPTFSMATRRRARATDSESDLADAHSPVGSPCSTRSRGTPCSSRTGSGNSRQGTHASRNTLKDLSIVLETDMSLDEYRLDSTVIGEDADCTLLEEEKGVCVIPEVDVSSAVSDTGACAAENISESAVSTNDQREELSTENKDTLEMETTQEVIPSLEMSKPVRVTAREETSEITDEKDEALEAPDVETHSTQGDNAVDVDACVETQPSVVEKMEVSAVKSDDQQVVDSSEAQDECILVASRQEHKITVEPESEKQPTDITVQSTKVISLLDSSDEEDEPEEEEEEEEMDGSDDKGSECIEEDRGRPSKKPDSAAVSVAGLFMIDTRPGEEADDHYYKDRKDEEATKKEAEQEAQDEEEEFIDEEGDEEDDEDAEILFSSRDPHMKELSSRIDPGIKVKALGGLYINFDGSKSKPISSSLLKLKEKKTQDEVMKKSVIGPDFEKKEAVPPYSESKKALKLKHREERAKSSGDGWFNMKAPEVTQELKGDLQVLKMRGSMDPKRFYKKNDRDGFPKYFQVGTVVDSPVDFYHSRIPKKDRKRTMVEELMADVDFRHKNKKKYQQILMEKAAHGAGKRNKKKNKFNKK